MKTSTKNIPIKTKILKNKIREISYYKEFHFIIKRHVLKIKIIYIYNRDTNRKIIDKFQLDNDAANYVIFWSCLEDYIYSWLIDNCTYMKEDDIYNEYKRHIMDTMVKYFNKNKIQV